MELLEFRCDSCIIVTLYVQINTTGPPEALEALQRQLSENADEIKLVKQELLSKQQVSILFFHRKCRFFAIFEVVLCNVHV